MSLNSQQYAALAQDSYNPRRQGEEVQLDGVRYNVLRHVDRPSGYQGTIYQRADTGEIVVAHRGTEFDRQPVRDGLADAGMVTSRANVQANDAIALTREAMQIARASGTSPEVTVTGHSLGGTLAQVSAHHFDLRGETFNAYGAVSLNRRIPEGGDRMVNHVMAGDPVSAASQHYGQVRVYANQQEIDTLRDKGYENNRSGWDLRNPLTAAGSLMGSHSMHNFTNVDGNGRPDRSVLTDPQAQQRAQDFDPMIDKYRGDVMAARRGLTGALRSPLGTVEDAIDGIRGPLPAGEPARREERERQRHSSLDAPETLPRLQPAMGLRASADDPSSMVDRMLAAAQSGDRDAFRQATQAAAANDPGRNLRQEAVATVDRQEQQALAQQAQKPQVEQPDAPSRGPRMA
ncbi:lipase [Lysobacter yananisis]|uniref:Lipase n=1 Tax=Lysobacter yananisis TaxID=1003114 RepID=A0ABY9PC88_9GAMM|nr:MULTISPECIES: hypothetical protein [Lysobacter]UZW60804.1 lipase [Lysobacter enzymogenes]WMT04687.1 lipase [Lysobacter yananisis]